MKKLDRYKTLYNYIKEQYKKSGQKLDLPTRCTIKNFGLDSDYVIVDKFCTKFNLDVDFDQIMSFIKDPENSYEISKFGHDSVNFIANSYSHNKKVQRAMQQYPDDYGLGD